MQAGKKLYIVLGTISVASVLALVFFLRQTQEALPNVNYHPSLFTEHASKIEKSINEIATLEDINLKKVYGGVVSHHMPTTIPMLAEFYSRLKQTRDVKTFIVIGPDHVDAGRSDITISEAEFATPFGPLTVNSEIVKGLEKTGLVFHDEQAFRQDHSIHTQLLFIKKLFPEAKIVPIVFRSSTTNEFARTFGKVIGEYLNEETFLVASVDFTHYLAEDQARPIDELSANILRQTNSLSAGLAEADSPQAMSAFIAALESKNANLTESVSIYNTADFSDNRDFTTGYVTGYWGIGSQVAGESDEN